MAAPQPLAPRRVLLEDVARRAGVSRSTASRALADNRRISAATRAVVKNAAVELGYVPNAAARSLRAQQTQTLGLVIVDFSDPYHGLVAAGFEIEASEAGYTVIFLAGLNNPVRERRGLKILVEQGTEGIALVSSVLNPIEARALARPNRLVLVQPDHRTLIRGRGTLPPGVILTDDVSGMEALVDHLVASGYRDIGYVDAGVMSSNVVRRDTAVRRLQEHGVHRPLRRFQAGQEGFRDPDAIAAVIARDLPEALICYDDKLAIALLNALLDHGIRVPDDVALVGFDDIPYARLTSPRLTTITVPTHEMGRLAARALIGAIHTGELPPAVVLPVELALRDSAPPRREPRKKEPDATIATGGGGPTGTRHDSSGAAPGQLGTARVTGRGSRG